VIPCPRRQGQLHSLPAIVATIGAPRDGFLSIGHSLGMQTSIDGAGLVVVTHGSVQRRTAISRRASDLNSLAAPAVIGSKKGVIH